MILCKRSTHYDVVVYVLYTSETTMQREDIILPWSISRMRDGLPSVQENEIHHIPMVTMEPSKDAFLIVGRIEKTHTLAWQVCQTNSEIMKTVYYLKAHGGKRVHTKAANAPQDLLLSRSTGRSGTSDKYKPRKRASCSSNHRIYKRPRTGEIDHGCKP